jgi:cardiolipin synthase
MRLARFDLALRAKTVTILATVAVTLVLVLAALNLMTGEQPVTRQIDHRYAIADPQFQRTLGVLLGPDILPGNRFEALRNGDEIFPSMLGAIRGAHTTITFETYIYWSGAIGDAYFPPIRSAGDARGQVFSSSPSGGSQSMQLMYLLMIGAAVQSIDLSSAYFLPDELARDTIVAAVRRGVRVRVITPGRFTDAALARRASRAMWGDLLRAGVEIYEYQPTMYHCKVLVADGLLVSVGSTNFDDRSFQLNDEASLNVYDAAFARRQVEIFEQDLAHSRRISLAEWESRPWTEKLAERAAALLGPQL